MLTSVTFSADHITQPGRIWSPTEFGAIVDDGRSDTAALQKAIDACGAQGGGIVRLPDGELITGSIRLLPNTTLELPAASVLRASKDLSEYSRGAWIFAQDAERIRIRGKGRLLGNGSDYFRINVGRISKWLTQGAPTGLVDHPIQVAKHPFTYMIQFVSCTDVALEDIQIEDSQHWTVHMLACDNVNVDRVRIRNSPYGPYTDGFDIDACRDVVIRDCEVTAGDDAFCVKNTNKMGLARESWNIRIERCIARTPTNGFKIGTETHANISRVIFRDCVVHPSIPGFATLAGVNIATVDGGSVSEVTVERIHMSQVRSPVFLRLGNRSAAKQSDAQPGSLKAVTIRDVTVDTCSLPIILSGIINHPVTDVALERIEIKKRLGHLPAVNPNAVPENPTAYPEAPMFGQLPAWGMYARHVHRLTIHGSTINVSTDAERNAILVAVDVEQAIGTFDPHTE